MPGPLCDNCLPGTACPVSADAAPEDVLALLVPPLRLEGALEFRNRLTAKPDRTRTAMTREAPLPYPCENLNRCGSAMCGGKLTQFQRVFPCLQQIFPRRLFAGAKLYRAVWRWHFYAGLYVIPFLLMLAITGGFMMIYAKVGNTLGQVPNVAVTLPPSPIRAGQGGAGGSRRWQVRHLHQSGGRRPSGIH